MKKIVVPACEIWRPEKNRFDILDKDYTLNLEHSLISISKWEQKWHKPFISDTPKTQTETLDYIKCMTLNQNIPDKVYDMMSDELINEVNEYIEDKATATWFNDAKKTGDAEGHGKKEVITSEIVYYWMVELHIPVEFQKWHFNRLMTLIKVINIKHEEADPNNKNKMSKRDILSQNAKLNAARRKAMKSKG